MQVLLLFLTVIFYHKSYGFNKLPSYIKPCSRSDPNFNECAFKNGQAAMPMIVEGDPTYHIPSFNPFKLDYVILEASDNIKLQAKNVEVHGFDGAILKELNIDLNKKVARIRLFVPVITYHGTYNMSGRILIMDLKGSGPMKNSQYDNDIEIKCEYSLHTQHNKEYLHVDKVNVDIKILKGVNINFGNLLNNTQLSGQMNAFLNENWKIFVEDILPPVNQVFAKTAMSILNSVASKVPYDNIFSP